MSKYLVLFILGFISTIDVNAQTYYYRFTKTIMNGKTSTAVSGGQFITFDGKRCYESDKYGNNVGNGILSYEKDKSNNSISYYWGNCYHGIGAFMSFNADKSLMNIETAKNHIYVYKRATAPAGITTCSLIRKPRPSNGGRNGGGGNSAPSHPIQTTFPQGGYNGGDVIGGNNNHRDNTRQNEQPVRQPTKKECRRCYGTGKCQICNGTGWVTRMGVGTSGYCAACRAHNGQCSVCNGRGVWYE